MSRLPFELLLALRYLRPKRTFVSIITLISVLGVTLGVAVLIIVISVMSGFDRDLREKVFGFNSHLTIFQLDPATGRAIRMSTAPFVMKTVTANPKVKGASAFVESQAVVETEPDSGASQIAVPLLRGVNPKDLANLSLITSNIIAGRADFTGRGLIVGTEFASDKYLVVGDHVVISNPLDIKKMRDTRTNANQELIPPADYEIRGIFDSGFYEYNASIIVTSPGRMRRTFFELGDDVEGVKVMLHNPVCDARPVKAQTGKLRWARATTSSKRGNRTIPAMTAVLVEKKCHDLHFVFHRHRRRVRASAARW